MLHLGYQVVKDHLAVFLYVIGLSNCLVLIVLLEVPSGSIEVT